MGLINALPWLAVAALVCGVLWYVRKSGKDAVKAEETNAAERIADAGKNPVRDIDDLADRLRNGERKL